jgi:hypothetical protein
MLEEYETRIKEHALYIYHQGATSGKLDDIPFSGGVSDPTSLIY